MKRVMRFEVPQFINIEDKLFGSFTFKEALYLVGGGGVVFMIYKMLPTFVALTLGIPIAGFSLALVFYKPNKRPFIDMVESFIIYTFTDKFYLWRQRDTGDQEVVANVTQIHEKFPVEGALPVENKRQKISDLAWSLDILDLEN